MVSASAPTSATLADADADAGSMTPSRNTRRYTLRSVQSSPGWSFFIGPRYTWGLIYGSESLSLQDLFADLTDVTLAMQAMQAMQAMPVMQVIQAIQVIDSIQRR